MNQTGMLSGVSESSDEAIFAKASATELQSLGICDREVLEQLKHGLSLLQIADHIFLIGLVLPQNLVDNQHGVAVDADRG